MLPLCPKTGRVMYWDRLRAVLQAEELSDEFVGVLCAYPCRHCGAWHVGSMSPEKLRALLTEIKKQKDNP